MEKWMEMERAERAREGNSASLTLNPPKRTAGEGERISESSSVLPSATSPHPTPASTLLPLQSMGDSPVSAGWGREQEGKEKYKMERGARPDQCSAEGRRGWGPEHKEGIRPGGAEESKLFLWGKKWSWVLPEFGMRTEETEIWGSSFLMFSTGEQTKKPDCPPKSRTSESDTAALKEWWGPEVRKETPWRLGKETD